MELPLRWRLSRWAEIIKVEDTPFGLEVQGTFNGAPFKSFTLEGKTASMGFDTLQTQIEFAIAEQLSDALVAVA